MHVYEHEPVRRDERHASRVLFPCVCQSDGKKKCSFAVSYPLSPQLNEGYASTAVKKGPPPPQFLKAPPLFNSATSHENRTDRVSLSN